MGIRFKMTPRRSNHGVVRAGGVTRTSSAQDGALHTWPLDAKKMASWERSPLEGMSPSESARAMASSSAIASASRAKALAASSGEAGASSSNDANAEELKAAQAEEHARQQARDEEINNSWKKSILTAGKGKTAAKGQQVRLHVVGTFILDKAVQGQGARLCFWHRL